MKVSNTSVWGAVSMELAESNSEVNNSMFSVLLYGFEISMLPY